MKRAQAKPKRSGGAKMPVSDLRDLAGNFAGNFRSDAPVSKALGPSKSSKRSLAMKKPKTARVDSRVMEYAEVLAHAVEIFGSRVRANAWLNRPSRIFNNQSPLQILTRDPAAVEEELVRIDEGIFY